MPGLHLPAEPSIAGSQALPPYDCRGVKLFIFPLLASVSALKRLCDSFLNFAPATTGKFTPILNDNERRTATVNLEVATYQGITATRPPWNEFGAVPQKELLFSVPVKRTLPDGTEEVGIFIPYIYVDDGASAMTGREVVGLPKLLARFRIPRDFPETEAPIVMSLKGRENTHDPLKYLEIITVEAARMRARATKPKKVADPVKVAGFLGPIETFKNSPDLELVRKAYAEGVVPGYSARILADPTDPSKDSYVSVIRHVYTFTFREAVPFDFPIVRIRTLGRLDFASTLGLSTRGGHIEPASPNAVELGADFVLDDVRTLWESLGYFFDLRDTV